MNSHTGSNLALSVALLFGSACNSPKSSETEAKEAKPTKTTSAPADKSEEPGSAKPESAKPESAKPKSTSPGGVETPKTGEAKPAVKTVNCLGIHECKGKSACHVAGGHACAGQNDCKGKGWIVVPEAECESKGGKSVKI